MLVIQCMRQRKMLMACYDHRVLRHRPLKVIPVVGMLLVMPRYPCLLGLEYPVQKVYWFRTEVPRGMVQNLF